MKVPFHLIRLTPLEFSKPSTSVAGLADICKIFSMQEVEKEERGIALKE